MSKMINISAIKRQFDYSFRGAKRISKKQYNIELNEAIARIEKGNFVSHKVALRELSEW